MPSKSESHLTSSNSLESNKLSLVKTSEIQSLKIKEELEEQDEKCGDEEEEEDDEENDGGSEDASYPMDLPLEVITTIEPFNYAYPYLKNMSNGVLTHRNIFTEQEREVLKKIVDKYRQIVDTRSRTREIYLEKQSVWQQIVEEYNSTENILVRTEKELKKCWDNMKYRARQAEKEQQRAENFFNSRKSPDPHQIAYNAVQAALEKMLSMQSQTGNIENGVGVSGDDVSSLIKSEAPENWNFLGLHQNVQSGNGECEKEDLKLQDDDINDDDLLDDDDQPVLKKARQESPKLSSILLGDTKKSSYLKMENSASKSQYNIPNCTKVTHIKKKAKKIGNNSSPVSILPKGLNSCVSIVNIPNPNQSKNNSLSNSTTLDLCSNGADIHPPGAINLGGGITISPQKANNFSTSAENSFYMRHMPYLKKMLPNKISRKNGENSHLSDSRVMHGHQNSGTSLNDHFSDIDTDRGFLEEKLLMQRLEFTNQEHALRMKVLEKQLQACTNESQFWALKMKMLKNGIGESSGKTVNGDA